MHSATGEVQFLSVLGCKSASAGFSDVDFVFKIVALGTALSVRVHQTIERGHLTLHIAGARRRPRLR